MPSVLKCVICGTGFRSVVMDDQASLIETSTSFVAHLRDKHAKDFKITHEKTAQISAMVAGILIGELMEPIEGQPGGEFFDKTMDEQLEKVFEMLGVGMEDEEEEDGTEVPGKSVEEMTETIAEAVEGTAEPSKPVEKPLDEVTEKAAEKVSGTPLDGLGKPN